MQTPMQEWYSPICWYCAAGLIVTLVPVMSVTVKVSVCQGLASVVVTMISSPTDQSTGSSNTRTLSPSITVRARRVHFTLGASPWRSSPPYTADIRQEHVRMTGNTLSIDFHLANTLLRFGLAQPVNSSFKTSTPSSAKADLHLFLQHLTLTTFRMSFLITSLRKSAPSETIFLLQTQLLALIPLSLEIPC